MEMDIEKTLIQQLEKRGIQLNHIPRFLKDLENTLFDDSSVSLDHAKSHLNFIGWGDIQLDYHTFQLAKEYFSDVRGKNSQI